MITKKGFAVGKDILLAHCPERILPGNIFHEIVYNDRVIGGVNEKSCLAAKEVYESFVKGDLSLTDDVTAELCKLMENTYRDVNIALANEFSAVGESLGIDPQKAIEFANQHPRVNILKPGIGVGGHCIPIDPWFIKEVDPENATLIFTARKINEQMPAKTAAKIRRAVGQVKDPVIIAVGVTYKPNSNDLRESPALEVIRLLLEDGYNVKPYDPLIKEYGYSSLVDIVEGSDCLAVLVEHDLVIDELEKREATIKKSMRHPIIMRF